MSEREEFGFDEFDDQIHEDVDDVMLAENTEDIDVSEAEVAGEDEATSEADSDDFAEYAEAIDEAVESEESVFEEASEEEAVSEESDETEDVISEENDSEEESVSEDEEGQSEDIVVAEEEPTPKPNKKKGLSITLKLIALCVIPMIMVSAIITYISVSSLTNTLESEIEKSLQLVAVSVSETYDNLYRGDYAQGRSGKVTKGDETISGNTKLIDGLQAQTGYHMSMLWGPMRLVTTFRKNGGTDGPRNNGVAIEDEIYARIANGESFMLSGVDISGTNYYLYYKPLVNSDGSVIGAVEAGTPYDEVQAEISAKVKEPLVISSVLIFAAIIFAFILSRGMASSMKKTDDFITKLRNGHLDIEPDSKMLKRSDEIGSIYDSSVQLQVTLRDVVIKIKSASEKLINSSVILQDMALDTQVIVEEVVSATDGISEKAAFQSEGAEDVNTNVNMINSDIGIISRDMDSLVGYANSMAEAERQSQQIVEELNNQSYETRASLGGVTAQIDTMNSSVQEIKKAIKIISDIADETDLLSLNASIEAARAGEAGRGFAVVAEQIGKLALQSNNSAMEISNIIQEVMDNATRTVEIMQELAEDMNRQQQKLDETRNQSRVVSEGVEQSISGIEGIREKVNGLGYSSMQIQESVGALSMLSTQTKGSANDAAETVQGMQETMSNLRGSADELTVLANQFSAILKVFDV